MPSKPANRQTFLLEFAFHHQAAGVGPMKFCFLCALLACSMAARAQDLPPGVRLGMGVDELRQALPALDLVRRPQKLAGGLAGSWRLASTEIAGLPGSETFFFAAGTLRRIEFVASTDAGVAAFDRIVAWARGMHGPEQAAENGSFAAWSSADVDIYVRLAAAPHAAVQLVFSARPARDDRAL